MIKSSMTTHGSFWIVSCPETTRNCREFQTPEEAASWAAELKEKGKARIAISEIYRTTHHVEHDVDSFLDEIAEQAAEDAA